MRDRLKQWGGSWHDQHKHWEFYSLNSKQRFELSQCVGIIVTEPQEQSEEQDDSDKLLHELLWGSDDPELADGDCRSNIYGDDLTWFNYFAGKNPIVFFGFSSLAAMTKFVKSIPLEKRQGRRADGWKETDLEWIGTDNMNHALKLARDGWPDGVEMANEIVERLLGQHAIERRRQYSVAGGSVNVGRLLAGNPKHMVARPKRDGEKIITFFVEACMSASIETEHAIIRAATVAAIADILAINGFSCEIISVTNARQVGKNSLAYQFATVLKTAGEPLNLNDVVFGLGHPSYLRRLVFACNGSCDDLSDVWSSMGMPTNAFDKSHPTNCNEFYIKKINHGSKINDELPLVETAIQIWDLIIDDELPITLKHEE